MADGTYFNGNIYQSNGESELFEKTVTQTEIYRGKVIALRVDDALDAFGRPIKREVITHPGGACVVAIDNMGFVLLEKQYRYGAGEVLTEIPAGKLEAGEDPLVCAKRELTEETGYEASDWVSLGCVIPTPAYDTERIYMYLAKNLTFKGQNLDEGERIDILRVPMADALTMARDGRITDAKTVCALLKASALL